MNRKILITLMSAIILSSPIFIFCSCSNPAASDDTLESSTIKNISTFLATATPKERDMLEQLCQIRSNWTEQQVTDLLGAPDRYGERSVVAEVFYTVDENTDATIAFWSEGIEITVYNSETGERAVILEGPMA